MIPLLEEIPVAILAGGLASRLRPLTERIPKALAPVCKDPFLAHQLRQLAGEGIRKVVLCTGYLGEMIESCFGQSAYGVSLTYSHDGPNLLGTGGALQKATPFLGDTFFVLYGDSYLRISYRAVAKAFFESGKTSLMTVYENADAWDTSNVEYHPGAPVVYNKRERTSAMRHIDYGLSMFRSTAFSGRKPGERFDLADIQQELSARGDLAGFEAKHRFYEIGVPSSLAEFESFLSSQNAP